MKSSSKQMASTEGLTAWNQRLLHLTLPVTLEEVHCKLKQSLNKGVTYLAFADNTAVVVGMTVVVLAAEDMADRAVNLLADMAFVAFADIAVVAVDKDPVVDTAVGMVDADHTA